ncbi:HPF/RaiA family ribosome-associated protein [Formosa sediminum]|uniref:HPF/RaiA family ribosome-associated protein n=1 Tax=Formosa sediminum TaxID=2594004 RepID=A0A516GM81_9FLAO|nr:HPF/RaiA family ribosome-associated protein [Formosa sediminum]QDO92632.1 HPF/RaiA family ribosome-associated protein [Formosa sediminum]
MELQFKYVNIPKNNYFEYLVEEHLNPLAKKFPYVIGASVYFKVKNKSTDLDNVCKIKLNTMDNTIYAIAEERSIELAIKKTSQTLESKLKDSN